MIRLPGQRAGRRIPGPVSQIDIVPTLLELMGQPIPDHLQGKSLRSLFVQNGPSHHAEDVFIEWNGPNTGVVGEKAADHTLPDGLQGVVSCPELEASIVDPVRSLVTSDGWKLNCSALGQHELYNLNQDPLECRNLAHNPEHGPRMRELADRIYRWQERTGDSTGLPLV
jgi:arylsulfatase A-like enzyme